LLKKSDESRLLYQIVFTFMILGTGDIIFLHIDDMSTIISWNSCDKTVRNYELEEKWNTFQVLHQFFWLLEKITTQFPRREETNIQGYHFHLQAVGSLHEGRGRARVHL